MRSVVMVFECDCGEDIKHRVGVMTDTEDIELPWDLCSQTEFECNSCGKKYYTGDFEYLDEDEI